MKIVKFTQGTPEWKKVRLENFTASEAPSMMGISKFMSRNELLKLKKTGNEKPISDHLQALFDKGHAAEARARPIIEKIIGEELYPVTGILEGTKYLSSFDGLTMMNDINFEHKLWNQALAENIRNQVLEPHYYWQLEQQMMVSGAEKTIFVVSDGTENNMEHMWYESVPERRIELVAGWNQFAIDLETYEVEAIQETTVSTVIKALPVITFEVKGTEITSNIGACLDTLAERSQLEMSKVLETDQDFADKDTFNKAVKKARADLKLLAENAQNQFQSHAAFVCSVKEADSILQKMQSHGEKQVKDAKEAKKTEIFNIGVNQILQHVANIDKVIEPIKLQVLIDADHSVNITSAMKNKRTIESLQNAVDSVVAEFKIEANQVANKVKENLLTMRELASEHKFLFSDTTQLVQKDNEDLIAVIKTRISDHESAEKERLEKEREQIRIEEEAKAQKKIADEKKAEEAKEAEERGNIAKAAAKREQETKPVTNAGASTTACDDQLIADQPEDDIPFTSKEDEIKNQLILVRGLPGSGKTTLANDFGRLHFEADTYHVTNEGDYLFKQENIKAAHQWCQEQTLKSLQQGFRVVVSNTFVKKWEIQPYLDMGFNTHIIEATGKFNNIHNVPQDVLERMKEEWEEL